MPSPQSVESWWRRVVVGGATIRLDRAPFRQDAAPCNYLKSFHSCVETRSPDPKVTGYTVTSLRRIRFSICFDSTQVDLLVFLIIKIVVFRIYYNLNEEHNED